MSSLWKEWLAGLRIVRQSRVLTALFSTLSIFFLAQGIINVSIIVFIEKVLHGGAQLYGWLITSQGVGSLIGALVISSLSKHVRPVWLMIPAMFIGCLVILLMVNIPIVLLEMILIAFAGLFIVGFLVLAQTLLQKYTSDEYRGRVLGAFTMVASLMMLIGMGLASGLGDSLGSVWLLDSVAGLLALCGLVTLWKLWSVQVMDTTIEPELVAEEQAKTQL